MSETAARWRDIGFAFSVGWFWMPLFLVATEFHATSDRIPAALFALAAVACVGIALVYAIGRTLAVRVSALVGLALGVVLLSAFLPVTVPRGYTAVEVGFGLPFRFVFVESAMFVDPSMELSVNWIPPEHPADIDQGLFLLSWLTVFTALALLSLVVRAGRRQLGGHVSFRQAGRA